MSNKRNKLFARGIALSLVVGLAASACGGSDEESSSSERVTTAPSEKSAESTAPKDKKSASTPPCERVSAEDLSRILGVTVPSGTETRPDNCFYDTGAPQNVQVLIQVNAVASGGQDRCKTVFGQDGEPFTVGGQPGFWDGSRIVKVCGENETVTVQVTPGGAEDRDAILEIAKFVVKS